MIRMKLLVLILAAVLSLTAAQSAEQNATSSRVRDLNTLNWNLANLNGSINTEIGSQPKMVLEALVDREFLTDGDPISGFNSRNYRWVASETWSMYAEFQVDARQLDAQNIDLVLEGIDTIASVYLNNDLIGKCNNAHKQYRFGVVDSLIEGTNLLEFVFSPAPEYAAAKSAEYPITVPQQPYSRGYPYFNFIRKPASDFGWDWGPAFAPSGVFGSVRLETYNTAYLTGCSIAQAHSEDGSVLVSFRASFQAPVYGETGTLMAESDDMKWMATQPVTLSDIGEAFATVEVTIKDDYDLWWPVGYGNQALYNFTITYTPDESNTTSDEPGQDESYLSRRLGIRNIELVQEPIRDPAGLTFYFRVNGIPVYARGSNMIPLQIFHSQNSEAGYRLLLEDAVEANMNMIRVWGGGLYQQDVFYDLCDEMGLLVWQEAMFACAQYPIDSDFLQNVQDEISYQGQRLGHHASLAVWGGNNEVETSFTWFPESSSNPPLFVSNYVKLFVDTIRSALLLIDPEINFLDSSPSKGVFSLDPYTKRWGNPSAVNAGDVHFYDYNSNCLSLDAYPRAKFVSEYGFMSFPSFSVYQQYTNQSDWSLMSNMTDYRQNHPDGNSELQSQMKMHFPQYASSSTNPSLTTRLFQQWIYLTQYQQSMCYEAGITHWRRLKSAPDAQNMGVLYWQLNDIWAGPSWSGRDFGGHWKLLMYSLRRMFSPVLISGTYNKTIADALTVSITNDQPYKVSGTALVEVIQFSARGHDQPVITLETDYEVGALDSKVVNTTAIKSKLNKLKMTLQQAIVRLSTTASGNKNDFQAQTCLTTVDNPFSSVCTPAKGLRPTSGPSPISFNSSQVVWLTEPKEAAVPTNPGLRVSNFRQLDDKTVAFQITSRNVAVGVQLDTDSVDGIFSDNNILVVPWENRQLNFTGREVTKAKDLEQSITIMSLADTLTSGTPNGPFELVTS